MRSSTTLKHLRPLFVLYSCRRFLPWWGVLCTFGASLDLFWSLGLLTVLSVAIGGGCLWITFILTHDSQRMAHSINREFGTELDVLCAAEHLGSDALFAAAHRVRVEQKLSELRAEFRFGRSAYCLLATVLLALPLISADRRIEARTSLASVESEIDRGPPDRLTKRRDDRRRGVSKKNRRVTTQSQRGKTSEEKKGRGRVAGLGATDFQSTESKALSLSSGKALDLNGLGYGRQTAGRGGRLTATANTVKLESLTEDRRDPAEKYPFEYREAIKEWFRRPVP